MLVQMGYQRTRKIHGNTRRPQSLSDSLCSVTDSSPSIALCQRQCSISSKHSALETSWVCGVVESYLIMASKTIEKAASEYNLWQDGLRNLGSLLRLLRVTARGGRDLIFSVFDLSLSTSLSVILHHLSTSSPQSSSRCQYHYCYSIPPSSRLLRDDICRH